MSDLNPENKTFLTSKHVRERYGVTTMTLWRWCRYREGGFPCPMKLGGTRNYWRLSDLLEWEASRTQGAA